MTLERPVESAAAEAPHERDVSPALAVAGVVVCGLTAILAALIEVLLTPLYLGRWLFPITLVLAIGTNIALPILARQLVNSTVAAMVPVMLWLITVLGLSLPRAEGDVLLPGGSGPQQWVSYGLLLCGGTAGAITVAVTAKRRPRPAVPQGAEAAPSPGRR